MATPKELLDWETQTNTIRTHLSGNCNFQYITGLSCYLDKPHVALVHILTKPYKVPGNWGPMLAPSNGGRPEYTGTPYAMYLFAQGSEDPVKLRPYGPQLKDTIEANGLGEVLDCGPAANLMHNNKPGILYVWKIDHKACRKWWDVNVYGAWQERNKRELQESPKPEPVTLPVANPLPEMVPFAHAVKPLAIKRRRWRCKRFPKERSYAQCLHLNEADEVVCASCRLPRILRRLYY